MDRIKDLSLALAMIALVLCAVTRPASATPSFNPADAWNAVTTFESIGVYWKPSGTSATQTARVRFREESSQTWRDGLDLWYDARNTGEYRGSLVELKPNTAYVIQLRLGAGAWSSNPPSCTTGANDCVLPVTGACTSTNRTQCTRTWSDDFSAAPGYLVPVPPTGVRHIEITGSGSVTTPTWNLTNGTLTVTVSNAPDATYAVIQGENYPQRSLVQPNAGDPNNCINVTGVSHVVIRGLQIVGCARNGIALSAPSHHIVIDDNEISGWGGWGHDELDGVTLTNHPDGDSAVQCRNPTGRNVHQVVVQRNRIHDPRWAATHWFQSQVKQPGGGMAPSQMGGNRHPTGPSATGFDRCGNNHVIRYNDIFATEPNPSLKWYEHAEQEIKYFMDAMTGAENKLTFGSTPDQGFPWADSDIYGNYISHTYDDAIESEGYNRNVRIWKNYTNKVFVNIGNSWNTQGPLYVWRNVSDLQSRMTVPTENPDNTGLVADRGPFIKAGAGGSTIGAGRSHYFHNTALQAPPSTCGATTFPCGAGSAIRRDENYWNVHSKNNIWQDGWRENIFDLFCDQHETDPNGRCDIDYDMFNRTAPLGDRGINFPSETHGFANTKPTYAVGGSFPTGGYPTTRPTPASPTGNFQITGTGANGGTLIPNFNDQYSTLDVGAQSGTENMVFGRAAAPQGPTGPSVTIDQATGQPDPSNAAALNFTAVFSDNVTGFTGTDVTVTGTAGGTKTATVTGGPSTFNVAVSGMTTNGTVIVSIPAGAAQNSAGGSNSASTSTDNTVTFSTSPPPAPTVSINQAAGQADPSAASPINFTAIFSENVTGFTGSDVTVSGTAGGTKTVTVSGGPSTYTVAVSGMTTSGTVIVSIPAGAAQNAGGTSNAASTSNDNQVTFSTGPVPYELFVSASPGLTVNRTAGERFDFAVEAADGRTLASVKFYIDNVLKATDTTAPFQYSWTTAAGDAAGPHVLRAEATDGQGNVASETRNLTLLAADCDGLLTATPVPQGTPLAVQGMCSNYKTVTEMEFLVDGVLRGSDVTNNYTWTLDTSALSVGSHTVAINGKFAPSGSSSASTTFTLTAPAVALTLSPGPVILPDETITISAAAGDGRALRQVDFYVDGIFKAGTSALPHQYPWTPGNAASSYGRHTLVVQATDTNGSVLTATRDLLVQPRTCSLLLGLSRYIAGNGDTVYVMPHRIAQGQPVTVQSTCSSWMTVNQVEFYVDGVLTSTDTSAPYTWTLGTTGLAIGTHTLATKGRLAGGGESNDSVTIEIVAP